MSSLGIKSEKMKKTRKSSKIKKGERVKKMSTVSLPLRQSIPEELLINVDESRGNFSQTTILSLFEGSLVFRISGLNEEEEVVDGGGWKAGDIEIRENGVHWKGIRTDMNMCGVVEINWEIFKEMAQISAQDCDPVKYKPFEEIHGQDIKASTEEKQCIVCHDNTPTEGKQKQCIICHDNTPQCANTGCGHMIFCINCANNFTKGKENACPVCRCPIEKLIRIF